MEEDAVIVIAVLKCCHPSFPTKTTLVIWFYTARFSCVTECVVTNGNEDDIKTKEIMGRIRNHILVLCELE